MVALTIFSKPLSMFTHAWSSAVSVLKKLVDGPAVPYVVTYKLPVRAQIPAGFEVSRYKGLALCHIASVGTGGGQLVAYWNAEPYYVAHGSELESELQLPAPDSEGLLAELKMPKEKWWQRFSLKDWMISTAAVATALTLLWGNLAYMFEAPHAQVAFADLTPVNVTVGMPLSAAVFVINDSAYTKTAVQTIDGIAKSESGPAQVPLASNQPSLPALSVGELTKVTLSGSAPQRQSEHGPPEVYDIVGRVTAKTGLFRGPRLISTSMPEQIKVWPSDIGWDAPKIQRGGGTDGKPQDIAQVIVRFYPGKAYPEGATGTILVTSAPDEVSQLSGSQVGPALNSPAGPLITRTVSFHTPAMERFKASYLIFNLNSAKPLQRSRWEELVKSIEVSVQ